MGLCCCFPSSAQQTTTTRGKSNLGCCASTLLQLKSLSTALHTENQTFRGTEQDGVSSNSMRHTADTCSLSSGATSAYPAPTEHRLSWSHAPHPPSVASSTLFDPEGNKLLLLQHMFGSMQRFNAKQMQPSCPVNHGCAVAATMCAVYMCCVCHSGAKTNRCSHK